MATPLAKVVAVAAAHLTPHFEMSDDGRSRATPEQSPGELLDALMEAECHRDAVALLAHGLGRREAVWWACVCARATLQPDVAPEVETALAAAEAWCYDPSDENRRAAFDAAEAQGKDHAASCAALGAFWGGDNMAPPESGVTVPPGPFLTAKAVHAAVVLAAVSHAPEKASEKLQDFIERGVDIANGGWGNELTGGA